MLRLFVSARIRHLLCLRILPRRCLVFLPDVDEGLLKGSVSPDRFVRVPWQDEMVGAGRKGFNKCDALTITVYKAKHASGTYVKAGFVIPWRLMYRQKSVRLRNPILIPTSAHVELSVGRVEIRYVGNHSEMGPGSGCMVQERTGTVKWWLKSGVYSRSSALHATKPYRSLEIRL